MREQARTLTVGVAPNSMGRLYGMLNDECGMLDAFAVRTSELWSPTRLENPRIPGQISSRAVRRACAARRGDVLGVGRGGDCRTARRRPRQGRRRQAGQVAA